VTRWADDKKLTQLLTALSGRTFSTCVAVALACGTARHRPHAAHVHGPSAAASSWPWSIFLLTPYSSNMRRFATSLKQKCNMLCSTEKYVVSVAAEQVQELQLEQVQTAGPRNQTVHHAVHTSSSIGIATSCMRQVQQDTAASATALVCLHVSCPAGHIPAVSAGSEVLVNFTSRNQRDHAR
jgi:hypothetical protein